MRCCPLREKACRPGCPFDLFRTRRLLCQGGKVHEQHLFEPYRRGDFEFGQGDPSEFKQLSSPARVLAKNVEDGSFSPRQALHDRRR